MARLLTVDELQAGLPEIRRSPADGGIVQRIVRRPVENQREEVAEAVLDPKQGLVGDCWGARPKANVDMQLTLMNARAISLIAGDPDRWPLAGDQLFVDLHLSTVSLPAGTRLSIGSAIIEVTAIPHRGCGKFRDRFGFPAMRLVNSDVGCELNLRGLNARVVRRGSIRRGDAVRKIAQTAPPFDGR